MQMKFADLLKYVWRFSEHWTLKDVHFLQVLNLRFCDILIAFVLVFLNA